MAQIEARQQLDAAVRGIATASKTLKLYPPTSPIPQQAVETALDALEAYLQLNPVLSLSVARDGFSWHGEPIGTGIPGAADLADALREHGVAEIDILTGSDSAELLRFLGAVGLPVEEVRASGGMGATLAAAGVECVRTTEVRLTVIEDAVVAPDEDVDEFLRQLSSDSEKLAAWMAAASAGDPAAFAEGLDGLAASAGPDGLNRLVETMARAFMMQEADGKDALIGLALDEGSVRELAGGMFSHLGVGDIASSLCEGLFGKNMLSLSNSLTHLPLQERMSQIYDEVQRMLAGSEHTDRETGFLQHMMEVHANPDAEKPLIETDATYLRVAEVAMLAPREIDDMRSATARERATAHSSGVTTMLALLDQQSDFELYCRSVDSLANLVPRLIEDGELGVAQRVLKELTARQARAIQPWPELTERLSDAVARAVDRRSMSALMKTVLAEPESIQHAADIVHLAGDPAGPPLIAEAIAAKDEGIEAAEKMLGRRVLDLLAKALPEAQWFQVGPVVRRLAREGDPRSMQAVETVVRRPDDQSRREAATALASIGGTGTARLLEMLLRDPSPEVEMVAIKAIGKYGEAGSAGLLSARLDELDMDSKDFALAREIIGALARVNDPAASGVLERIANRKALIKRGHFAEIHGLADQAIAYRSKSGDRR